MAPAWTVTLSYLGYAVALMLGALCWLLTLLQTMAYARVEAALWDERWMTFAHLVARNLRYAVAALLACAVAAFLLAALPAGEEAPVAGSHKAYQLRFGAIALCFAGLIHLTQGRMGAFDVEIAAVAVFAWALWALAAGWLAASAGAPVAGPFAWWLALAVDGLALAAFAALVILIKIEGFRLF